IHILRIDSAAGPVHVRLWTGFELEKFTSAQGSLTPRLAATPTSRDTTSARYITPANISISPMAREKLVIGITVPMPVLVKSAKLRNISSLQLRGCPATPAPR